MRKDGAGIGRTPPIQAALRVLAAGALVASLSAPNTLADPHAAFGGLINTVNQVRSGAEIDPDTQGGSGDEDGASTEGCNTTASACYINVVDPVVQQSCIGCHQQGLTADLQGARLLFTSDPMINHTAIETFVTSDGVDANWLLSKIVGDLNHGGGPVLAQGGGDYFVFADYLTLLVGANVDDGSANASEIWSGTIQESRETTLRRAAILLAGKVPTKAGVKRADSSDAALRGELISLMNGDGFHDFLVNGANDRLLTNGLINGLNFDFDEARFPAYVNLRDELPERRPAELDTEEYWDWPYLDQGALREEFRNAIIRAPVELIAYIVENNRSYKEVVTADYTMVNAFSALGYRSDVVFDNPLADDRGFFDRSLLNAFKPAQNAGQCPWTNESCNAGDAGGYVVENYNDWPHSGVLSMPSWLSRYPSTDTNRNRARARWTYYQFLGVDIEKSAPRTTDPVALADTNNPTMNNPACTVCHERMDPVAGAYQSFGDAGHYLDQYGGIDSLSDTYKYPQRAAGDRYELPHDVLGFLFHEISLPISTQSGGNFAISNPDSCIEDEENSSDDEWVGWCTDLGVADITVYADGEEVFRLEASEFEAYWGFSISTYIDGEGVERPQGYLDGNFYQLHHDVWMAFDLDLAAGDYEVVASLRTGKHREGSPRDYAVAGLLWSEGFIADSGYQYGDTWYRDMRAPGFNGRVHSSGQDSLQWLGQQIASDARFPAATVKFWWPAIFGTDVLAAPADRTLPEYEAQLLAFNAQEALVDELSAAFVAGGYKLKGLLADMVLSRWFRTTEFEDGLDEVQSAALEAVGRGRLLSPEELDRKNLAVLGRSWGSDWRQNRWAYKPVTKFNDAWSGYATFYGGIDAANVTKRNRQQTSLMSNVSEKMAVELACQVVLQDFNKPQSERVLFARIERTTDPTALAAVTHELVRDSRPQNEHQLYERSISFTSGVGGVSIKFDDTQQGCFEDEENSEEGNWVGWCAHMGVAAVEVYQNGRLVTALNANEFENSEIFIPQSWTDDETGELRINGWFEGLGNGEQAFMAHTGSQFAFHFDLAAGDYTLKAQLVTRSSDGHPNDTVAVALAARAQRLDMSSPNAQAVAGQLDDLYLRATGNTLSGDDKSRLMEAYVGYAAAAEAKGDRFNGHCAVWQIWDNSVQITYEEDRQRFADPVGSMSAWTLMLHALMTSYSYLHD